MKRTAQNPLRDENGYTLIIVLLVITLLLAFAATFMATSMNHSFQERTVESGNQSVAAAEMGIQYETAHFEEDFNQLLDDINLETQIRINKLRECIQPPIGEDCDSEQDRQAYESRIESDMRALFFEKVYALINAYKDDTSTINLKKEFAGQAGFYIENVTSNLSSDLPVANLKEIEMNMTVKGEADERTSTLMATVIFPVPERFLNPDEAEKVQTTFVEVNEDMSYEDIFNPQAPTISCSTLIDNVKSGTATAPYKCKADDSLNDIVDKIDSSGQDPRDFTVFTSNFVQDVCESKCNNLNNMNFSGVNVVVDSREVEAFNNMNNLVNANLIINGTLSVGNNLNNLGKNGVKQTLIVKGLNVDNNIQNMSYTNLLVLGNPDGSQADLKWGNHFDVDIYSRLCIDIDRIKSEDLIRLSKDANFTDSGSLIYYSRDPNKTFRLQQNNDYYVVRAPSYASFLEKCGVTQKKTVTRPVDMSVPSVLDPNYDIQVDY
ncbi:hypothetical protein C772_02872 [Bhargavaea cecembensis DSE10]|uniref:Uncharacterized protein n=1 Tax=Bhargavaea cecembensis DSE10 TaxID=1235279 RepID=M7NU50_9BACL|nr:hypothetical protein [Bhargavaea cecembensis]EMR05200.1 hypothetical protein C772_02872 [Bhargavaea cecembensis DSE10]